MKQNILVFSSLFPSKVAPTRGLFIRERMFRVGEHVNLTVISPVPWFPGQKILRFFKKDYRPEPERREIQQGIRVYFPRFLSVPGIFRRCDAFMMYLGSMRLVAKLNKERKIEIIDSHFTYPDGLAATLLAKKFGMKSIITLRGTEVPHSALTARKKQLLQAWERADRIFSVSDSLRKHAISLGANPQKCRVIGNGIDTEKFIAIDKHSAREKLNIDAHSHVLITVGGLVERKGFHRVVACLPDLLKEFPKTTYLIVGGENAEGNYKKNISMLADALGVADHVYFLGTLLPEDLSVPLSAADAFVLSSRNEGWANVILESMACGTPVIASDVGGNAEVVNSEKLGYIVPFGNQAALLAAIKQTLSMKWDAGDLVRNAEKNRWDNRVTMILQEYNQL